MELESLNINFHDIGLLIFVMTILLGFYFLPIHLMFKNNRSLGICLFVLVASFAYSNFEAMMFYYCFIRIWWHYRSKVWAPATVSVGAPMTLVQVSNKLGLTLTKRSFYLLIGLWIFLWWVGYLIAMGMPS